MADVNAQYTLAKIANGVKHAFATLIDDQTELKIGCENARFSHEMSGNASKQKEMLSLRLELAKRDGDTQAVSNLEKAIDYQNFQETQWKKCANAIETWIYSGPTYRVTHKLPEYDEFGV